MKCKMCEEKIPEFLGPYCSRCDKIVGDVNADLAAELGQREIPSTVQGKLLPGMAVGGIIKVLVM